MGDCCEKLNEPLSSRVVYFSQFLKQFTLWTVVGLHRAPRASGFFLATNQNTMISRIERPSKGPSAAFWAPVPSLYHPFWNNWQFGAAEERLHSIPLLILSLVVLFHVGPPELPGQWPEAGRTGMGWKRGSVFLLWHPNSMGLRATETETKAP